MISRYRRKEKMVDYTFDVKKRSEFGKGFARRLRAQGQVPAVIYGAGKDAVHISLPTHDVMQALRTPNALFEISVESKKYLALVKDVQKDFVHRTLDHIDLLEVKEGQMVDVPVALKVIGEAKPATQVSVSVKSLVIKTNATAIPRFVEIDINGAEAGAHFTVGDVKIPEGSTTSLPPTHVIVAVKARAQRKAVQIDTPGGGPESSEGESSEDNK